MKVKVKKQHIELVIFFVSMAFLMYMLGALAYSHKFFPYHIYKEIPVVIENSFGDPWHVRQPLLKDVERIYHDPEKAYQGLNLVSQVTAESQFSLAVMTMNGEIVHEWNPSLGKKWPDVSHLAETFHPDRMRAIFIMGVSLFENGNLAYNFNNVGTTCDDPAGRLVWRYSKPTHHSMTRYQDNSLWVCEYVPHLEPTSRFPNRTPPFREQLITWLSESGEVIKRWSVRDLLVNNGYEELLFMGAVIENDDYLHLNDAEPFPPEMEPGVFDEHDVVVSLRNINTIFVFDYETEKIKFISTGKVIMQHDPDFIDGNRISVFDNNYKGQRFPDTHSQIVIIDGRTGEATLYYEGSKEEPFHTEFMGTHQWLPNGNLLIIEAEHGRAFEIDQNKEIVWQYINKVSDKKVSLVVDVQRLPLSYTEVFKNRNLQ